jgi:hypothetical protein
VKGVETHDGHFDSLPAALCSSLGPKSVRKLWSASIDRRYYKYRKLRVLASFWPDTLWV